MATSHDVHHASPGSVSDPVERLTNLVAFLVHSERPVGQAQIVAEVPGYAPGSAGRRAFERDKRVLRDEGVPIREEKGLYSIPADEFYLPDLDLTDDERAALAVAVAAVPIAGLRPAAALSKLGGIGERLIAGPGPVADLEDTPILAVLHDAARRRAPVSFRHRDAERTIEPYALIFRGGVWYVHGLDRARGAGRSFRVDKLSDLVVGESGAFDRPDHIDLTAALPPGGGQPAPGEEAVEATVVIDKAHARRVVSENRALDAREFEDGSIELRVLVSHMPSFRHWLLGLLDHAEVTAPDELRADIIEWLQGLASGTAPAS